MVERYDVVILGGGNAGFGVSAIAQDAGKSVAFVEEWDFGGTCPNRGCTPKKVLVAAAHALHEIEVAGSHGIEIGKPRLDWRALIEREKDMIGFIPDAMAEVAGKRGDVYRGHGRFVGRNAIDVEGTVIEGDNIVIATGSRPRPLPIPGAELMITSDDVLSDPELPASVVFIGGGVIALEFSHVYARAGVEVTILEALPRLLPRVEADAVAQVRAESERIGIVVKTGVAVQGVAAEGGRLRVDFEHGGRAASLTADRVVNGTGRIANVDTLDLDAGGIKHDGLRIEVDDYLRSTSNPAVWVCGDALTSSAQLSPLASYEGRIVGGNIVAQDEIAGGMFAPDYEVVPSCVYTVPALSSVGLSEEEAEARGLDAAVKVSDMAGWFSGKSYAETVAWAKVLVDKATDRILGAHLVGHQGEELIHIFSLAMGHGITAAALKDGIFAFPTFSSDVKNLV